MYLGPLLVLLTGVPAAQPSALASANQPAVALPADEAAVKAAGLATSADGLLDFFRRRSTVAADPARLAALVKQLADAKAEVRDQAMAELIGHGPAAVPVLRQAINNADEREHAARASQCLQAIEGPSAVDLTLSQVRLLAARQPAGSVSVLLRFLPYAENDEVVAQVQAALLTLGLSAGKPDAALRQALEDAVPVRRAVAAAVLAQVGGAAGFPLLRPLLKDPKPSVRLKVALALIDNQDNQTVPFLIDLLPDLPGPQQKQVEEYLTTLAGEWAVVTPRGSDALARQLRRDLWRTWWRATDGPFLLKELRDRTLSDDEHSQVLALVQKLDAEIADERDKACEALCALGPRALGLLRQALAHASARQLAGLSKCVAVLEKEAGPPLPSAAPRLLGLRRPEGALAALLAYLPYAEQSDMQEQIVELIGRLGWLDGKADPLLSKALQDPVGIRRATAAAWLLRQGNDQQKAEGRKLLLDADAEVRWRVALALAGIGDKAAVPVLIALLTQLPVDQAWQVEGYLATIAAETAPSVVFQANTDSRKRCQDAWNQWWREHAAKVVLTSNPLGFAHSGRYLVVSTANVGSVCEMDRTGKVHWKLDNITWPMDAQVLPGQRLLIAEQTSNRVTERDRSGKILWEKAVVTPMHCRRLRNGHTFVANRNSVWEFDAHGKEVLQHQRLNETILDAQPLRDGHIAYMTYQGNYYRLDRTGKEVKHFRFPFNPAVGLSGGAVLHGDHVLVSVYGANKITEYDADGKTVWEATVAQPGTPTRLPNGNTLVVSANARIVELDRSGKVVSELKDLAVRPWRVYRR